MFGDSFTSPWRLHLLMWSIQDVESFEFLTTFLLGQRHVPPAAWLRKSHFNSLIYISQKHFLLGGRHVGHYLVNICTLLQEFH